MQKRGIQSLFKSTETAKAESSARLPRYVKNQLTQATSLSSLGEVSP